jgi:predicted nucleotidyltransferase
MAEPRPAEVLEELSRAQVEYVVVGMTAAILQGAPMLTNDVDIVHRRTPENVERLLRVLASLDAAYRTDHRRLRPNASILIGPGHNLFQTRAGDLDCLGAIDGNAAYEELLPDSTVIDLGDGLRCRALLLERVIEIKQRAARPKDLAALPVLRATLDELRRAER